MQALIGHSMGGKVVMTMAEQFSSRATSLPRPVQVGHKHVQSQAQHSSAALHWSKLLSMNTGCDCSEPLLGRDACRSGCWTLCQVKCGQGRDQTARTTQAI